MINVPPQAIELAKRFEGFHRVQKGDPGRAHPYVCPAGCWTIRYGLLSDRDHPPITEAEAEAHLAEDLRTALEGTLRYCPVLATEIEPPLAAIVDFTFNLGAGCLQTSTLRRRINERDWSPPSARSGAGSRGRQGASWSCGAARGGGRSAGGLIRTGRWAVQEAGVMANTADDQAPLDNSFALTGSTMATIEATAGEVYLGPMI